MHKRTSTDERIKPPPVDVRLVNDLFGLLPDSLEQTGQSG